MRPSGFRPNLVGSEVPTVASETYAEAGRAGLRVPLARLVALDRCVVHRSHVEQTGPKLRRPHFFECPLDLGVDNGSRRLGNVVDLPAADERSIGPADPAYEDAKACL